MYERYLCVCFLNKYPFSLEAYIEPVCRGCSSTITFKCACLGSFFLNFRRGRVNVAATSSRFHRGGAPRCVLVPFPTAWHSNFIRSCQTGENRKEKQSQLFREFDVVLNAMWLWKSRSVLTRMNGMDGIARCTGQIAIGLTHFLGGKSLLYFCSKSSNNGDSIRMCLDGASLEPPASSKLAIGVH
jgi:hypothetical protein